MNIIRRMGRLLALGLVVTLAVMAGLFLSACGRFKSSASEAPGTGPSTGGSPPSSNTAQTAAATGKSIDVAETQQGQPVPRNLLE